MSFDFFKLMGGKAGNIAGNLMGNTADGLGIASAFTKNDDVSAGLGMGSGMAAMLGGITGLLGAENSRREGDKEDAAWGFAESGLGLLGGIADTAAGAMDLAGNHAGEGKGDAAKMGSRIASTISGGIGILGGLVSGAHGIRGLIQGRRDRKEAEALKDADPTAYEEKMKELKKSRRDSIMGLIGAGTQIFSGITNIGSANASDKTKDAWGTAGKVSAVAGAVPGILSTIFGFTDKE